ncbi:serine/threonine protein kinase [Hyalangium sp.]|uniref:serine/threonine protein kinase n=1 Tax=Hyalangium sp. TaxID=2028555 RepID=UPI0039C87625
MPFGKYLLIKRLAVGGMAELFLAQEPPSPELVVLKRILPYLSEEPEFVQMFLDEARIAAQLHHPNIVAVYELGKLDNTIFIAMEFVEGVDLRRVVQEEGKFGANVPYGVAAAICSQVAEGLDYAHFSKDVKGVPLELIHRDVSPQNVMIAYDGRVKIVDFGIAKAGTYVNRSKPGVIKGKFLYLSPEQVSQDKLDHRADIFALGTMMYEITTGKSPFAKPTTEGILYAIRSEDPSPPHLLKDDYPTELSRIIMRCLTKDRSQRYQRASEVQADLEAFLTSGVIKQSTDISDYIARLMGEEEERTVLHIPIASAARKDATTPMAPLLTARPGRRPTGEGVAPPPDYGSEPEPPTQMARPRELLAQRSPPSVELEGVEEVDQDQIDETSDIEDEADVSTTIGTVPVGFVPPRHEPGESTVQERSRGRSSSPSGTPVSRRITPPLERDTEPRARRPSTPPSRRPLAEDEVDPSSPSISLTQPTVNQRLLLEEEDQEEREDQGDPEELDEAEADEGPAETFSVTPPTTGQRRRLGEPAPQHPPVTASTTGQRRRLVEESISLTQPTSSQRLSRQRQALRQEESRVDSDSGVSELDEDGDPTEGIPPDGEDDESTAGYEHESEPTGSSNRWIIMAAAAVVGLVILGLALYLALSSSTPGPGDLSGPQPDGPIVPVKASAIPPGQVTPPTPNNPPAPTPSDPPDAAPANGAVAAAGAENPPASPQDPAAPAGTAPANPPDNPPGGTTATGPTAVAANTATPPTTEGATAGAGTKPSTLPGTGGTKPVVPSTPAAEVMFKTNTAVILVDKKKIQPNKMLSLPAGKIVVEWWCPPKRKREGSDAKRLEAGRKKPYIYEIRCRKSSR